MGGEARGGRTSKATAAALGIPSCVRAGPAAGESIRNCWKRERVGAAGRASSAASQSLAGLGAWRSRFAVWAAAGRSETEIRILYVWLEVLERRVLVLYLFCFRVGKILSKHRPRACLGRKARAVVGLVAAGQEEPGRVPWASGVPPPVSPGHEGRRLTAHVLSPPDGSDMRKRSGGMARDEQQHAGRERG
jgi:hypothetical protein